MGYDATRSDRVERALATFGHTSLRDPQRRAIDACLEGRDVVLRLPTGGGKSLCYQLPAVVLAQEGRGTTLVVSPLVALMEDQVRRLTERGIAAAAVHRAVPARTRDEVFAALERYALVYVSPERWKSPRFRRAVAQSRIARLAVDEAHCISEWGHDFREDYLALGELRAAAGAPTLACTATATPRVMDEIGRVLGLEDPVRVEAPMARTDLGLAVEHLRGDKARTERLVALLEEGSSGDRALGRDPDAGRVLVYALTRARTRSVAEALRKAGFRSAFYHAGRTDGARAKAAGGWIDGRAPVLVATTAFGMGIDLPDVRLVVHVQAPGTLEAYAQQAGRAGRDGGGARCVLLYAPGDAATVARLRGEEPSPRSTARGWHPRSTARGWPGAVEGWKALQDYAFGVRCRMVALAEHFGDPAPAVCGRCDVCRGAAAVKEGVDAVRAEGAARRRAKAEKEAADRAVVLDEDQRATVLAFVDALRKPIGRRLAASALRGGRSRQALRLKLPENPAFGALRGVPEIAVLAAIDALLADGSLTRKGKKYPTVWMADKRVRPARAPGEPPKTPREPSLRAALRDLRRREARRRRWKPYQVFPNVTLDALVAERPASPDALLALPGMGPARVAKFADAILATIRTFGA